MARQTDKPGNTLNILQRSKYSDANSIRRTNLRYLAQQYGSNKALAHATGLSRSYISQIIGPNPSRPIGSKQARHIESALDIPEGWLDSPHGIFEHTGESGEEQLLLRQIAICGTTKTGIYPTPHPEQLSPQKKQYVEISSRDLDAYALTVDGTEYEPTAFDGDAVIIEPNVTVESGDEVLLKQYENDLSIRLVISIKPDHLIVAALNGAHRQKFESKQIEYYHYIAGYIRQKSIRSD